MSLGSSYGSSDQISTGSVTFAILIISFKSELENLAKVVSKVVSMVHDRLGPGLCWVDVGRAFSVFYVRQPFYKVCVCWY